MNPNDLWQALDGIGADYSRQLTQALLHFLWQGGVIAIAYAVVARGLRRANAGARYVAGVAALLLMAACLPATLLVLPSPHVTPANTAKQPRAASTAAATPATAGQSVADVAEPEPVVTTLRANPAPAADLAPSVASEEAPIRQPAADRAAALLAWASPYASSLYLGGVVLMLLRVALGLWGGRRLRRACTPLGDGPIFEMLRQHARRMGMRIIPAVAWCQRISVPVVVGVLRPMILLPASLASGLTPEQLEAVLLHELAHVRRYDLAVNILQRLVEALLFFHPAVWWLSRRVSAERENACDDLVVRWNCDRTRYADALLRVAELCVAVGDRRMMGKAALAATGGNPSQFKRRVLRLLDPHDKPALRLTTTGVVISLLLILSVILAPVAWRGTVRAEDAPRATKTSEPADAGENKNSNPQGRVPADRAKMLAETAERMASDKRIAAALQVLRTYDLHHGGPAADPRTWASSIRELIQIGTPAVPQLIQELDRTEREETLRALAFVLRGIGDPRAVPALIGAIPRALQNQCGDYGLRVDDPELLKFMQKHDLSGVIWKHSPTAMSNRDPALFDYGSAYSEAMTALEKLTDQSHGWRELCYVNDMGGVYELQIKRTFYVKYATRWADWWVNNWQKYVTDEADAQLDLTTQSLERYRRSIAAQPNQQPRAEFPLGPNVTGYDASDCFAGAFDEPSTRSMIDLDTGRCPLPPQELVKDCQGHDPSQNLLAWAQQEGVNLITIKIAPPGSDKSYYAFKPLGMKVWRIENDRFKNVQSELRRSKRLELPAPWEGLLAQIDEKTGAWDENLTVSFLFITNKGTCGAIQIQPPVSQEPASGPARKRAGVRYHFIYEEDAMNGALRAESQSATDVLPAAEVKPRDGSRIIARVGADAILESDLAVRINEYLEANKDRIPPGQLEETRKAQTRQRLKPLIETKLILQDAKRRIPAEGWSHVERQLSKHFEDVEQAKLMKKAGVGTPREFDQKLRALGTSLEREKRAFVERALAQEWVHQQIKPDEEATAKPVGEVHDDTEKKILQERWDKQLREYLAKLEARTPVWTIFDGDAAKASSRPMLPSTIRAEEAMTGRPMFGVGVNSDAGLVGTITLDEPAAAQSATDVPRPLGIEIPQYSPRTAGSESARVGQANLSAARAGEPDAHVLRDIVSSIRANYAGLGGIEANVERVIGHDILPPVVRDRKMPEPVERVIPHTPLPREVIDTKTPTATAPSGIAIGRKSETASGLPHTGRILLRGDAVRCDWVGKDSADTIAFFDNVWTQYFPRDAAAWLYRTEGMPGIASFDPRDVGSEEAAEHFVDRLGRSKLLDVEQVTDMDGSRLVNCLLEVTEGRQRGLRYRCWFDRDKRYLPVKVERLDSDGSAYSAMRISYQKVAPDPVWFLSESRTVFMTSGQAVGLRVTSVKIHQDIPDSAFRVEFPAGTEVHNEPLAAPSGTGTPRWEPLRGHTEAP